MSKANAYTLGWCSLAAGAAALELCSLRSGDPDTTLSAHSRLLFDRNHLTRGVLIAAAVWWVVHVIEPWSD